MNAATAVKTKASPNAKASSSKELKMTAAQRKAVEGMETVSARIRYLAEQGYETKEIPHLIPNASGGQLRYQHVRNVLKAPLAKQSA